MKPKKGRVSTAEMEGLDQFDGKYVVICESHGSILNCKTFKQATEAASDTAEFCSICEARNYAGNW